MCFGCNFRGSAIDLYMRWRNVTYEKACSELESLPNFRSLNALDMKLKHNKELPVYRKLEIMTEFVEKMQPVTVTDNVARRYLNSRGIADSTLNAFGIRFVHPQDLCAFAATQRDFAALDSMGLTNGSGVGMDMDQFYQWTVYSIIFPFWFCGSVTWIQGRCVGEPSNKKESKYHNVSTSLTYSYNHDVLLTETETVYICEGAMDVISMYELGHRSVIGLPGVNNFHANWLQDFKCKRVVLALDNDKAGQDGAEKLARLFLERGIQVERFPLAAEFKDVNQFLCKKQLLER